jgi:CRP-like cAMP-binding protein
MPQTALGAAVQLLGRWELDHPFTLMDLLSAQTMDAGALGVEAAQNDWSLAARDGHLELTVGPLLIARPGLVSGLQLFHHLRETLQFVLPADRVRSEQIGVRLNLPGGAPSEHMLHAVASLAAPLLVPVFDTVGAGEARLEPWGDGLEITFARPLLPEVFDELAPLIAAAATSLARDVQWGGVPASLKGRPEWVRLTSDGTAIVSAIDPDAEGAAAVLRYCAPALERLGRRGPLEAVRRLLTDPDLSAPAAAQPQAMAAAEDLPKGEGALLELIPFRTGGRPVDEIARPGTGCSEFGGFLSSGDAEAEDEAIFVRFELHLVDGQEEPSELEVRMSAAFVTPDGLEAPIPGLVDVPVAPRVVAVTDNFEPTTFPAEYVLEVPDSYVATLDPQALFPGPDTWNWTDLPEAFRQRTPDGTDPYTFANFFHQRVRVEFTLVGDGKMVDRASIDIEVYDLQRFGSLYDRLLQLVADDIRAQKRELGTDDLYAAHHPWYPVLGVEMGKADLTMRAIRQDVALQTKYLESPRWLLRVEVFLEFLTCCGIFEALEDTHGYLLSSSERKVLRESADFQHIRDLLDTEAWKETWELHEVIPPGAGLKGAGPVAFGNLAKKQMAIRRFVKAHHEDLKNAIDLAGPNLDGAQDAWHRVYRDAERAVVNSSIAAFPELRHLPHHYREFALWHVKGDISRFAGEKLLPPWLSRAFVDEDGLCPAGARQYRESMNEVAEWAQEHHLLDFAGIECVPRSVSLIEARLEGDEDRFASLQARDGYGATLEAAPDTVRLRDTPSPETVHGLLRSVPVFSSLDEEALAALSTKVERHTWVPGEDVVVQGDGGASLFVVESGMTEVLVEQQDRRQLPIARLGPGEVFGEMALLTGEPRSATVRAVAYTTAFEIRRNQLEPLLMANPSLVNHMSAILAVRLAELEAARDMGEGRRRGALRERIRSYFQLAGAESTAPEVAEADRVALLAKVPLFQALTDEEREELARVASPVQIEVQQSAVVRGDRAATLHVVVSGKLEVVREVGGKKATVGSLGPGDAFGEVAVVTGERSPATVQANETSVLLELGKSDLFPLIARRTELIEEMSDALATEDEDNGDALANRDRLKRRIRAFFLG